MTTHTDLIKWLREADFGAMQEYAAKHADALEAPDKEIEELRRDAERYRWLRNQHQGTATKVDAEWFEYTEPTDHAWMVFRPTAEHQSEPVGCIPGELDAAIDAAMKESE